MCKKLIVVVILLTLFMFINLSFSQPTCFIKRKDGKWEWVLDNKNKDPVKGEITDENAAQEGHYVRTGTPTESAQCKVSQEPAEGETETPPVDIESDSRQPEYEPSGIDDMPITSIPESPPPDNPVSLPQVTTDETVRVPTLEPLIMTEYMLRKNTGNKKGLPQWIELYNPNNERVYMNGYTLQYANSKGQKSAPVVIKRLHAGMYVEANEAVILATRRIYSGNFSGIKEISIYGLGIRDTLENGWLIIDKHNREIARVGEVFGSEIEPIIVKGKKRESHEVEPTEQPPKRHYYGDKSDIGSPGFYEPKVPAAPRLIRTKTVTWASMKRK